MMLYRENNHLKCDELADFVLDKIGSVKKISMDHYKKNTLVVNDIMTVPMRYNSLFQ